MTQKRIDAMHLFLDLRSAILTESLYALSEVLAQIEALPKPKTQNNRATHALLRQFIGEAIANSEKRLGELRTRYEALAKKDEAQL